MAKFELTAEQFLTLAALASKACEFEAEFLAGLHIEGHLLAAAQTESILRNAKPILAQLDEEYPGMLPLPHDGVAWKDWTEDV